MYFPDPRYVKAFFYSFVKGRHMVWRITLADKTEGADLLFTIRNFRCCAIYYRRFKVGGKIIGDYVYGAHAGDAYTALGSQIIDLVPFFRAVKIQPFAVPRHGKRDTVRSTVAVHRSHYCERAFINNIQGKIIGHQAILSSHIPHFVFPPHSGGYKTTIAQASEIKYNLHMIRPAGPEDSAAICTIYNYYVENTIISFEERPLQTCEMEERVRKISAVYPYLVLEEDTGQPSSGEISGYAYVNRWRERSAYRYAAELSIYLKNGLEGRGMGRRLLVKLLDEVGKTDIHVLVAGIVLPNDRSIALHEKAGFRKVAHFEKIGYKFNEWHDVGYWELLLK